MQERTLKGDKMNKTRTIHRLKLPERDADRRNVLGLMLHLDKKARDRLTIQEMEQICIKRGLLKEVEE